MQPGSAGAALDHRCRLLLVIQTSVRRGGQHELDLNSYPMHWFLGRCDKNNMFHLSKI